MYRCCLKLGRISPMITGVKSLRSLPRNVFINSRTLSQPHLVSVGIWNQNATYSSDPPVVQGQKRGVADPIRDRGGPGFIYMEDGAFREVDQKTNIAFWGFNVVACILLGYFVMNHLPTRRQEAIYHSDPEFKESKSD